MRICIITKFIPPKSTDGIPRNRWDYARQFTRLGHEVHIITSGNSEDERIAEGIYIHQVNESDKQVFKSALSNLEVPDHVLNHLSYSYLVYRRIKRLNETAPVHLIEAPLWDIEGYITRLSLPEIPFVVRLETTSMLLRELLTGQTPRKDMMNEIETHFMEIASGYVFDSWSILKETTRLYGVNFGKKPYAMVHHGIDLEGLTSPAEVTPSSGKSFKVLSVGRFEKRKGSDILVKETIPALIANDRDIEFHLVGKDNGEWDGFKDETGMGYHEYIRQQFKPYLNKQVFLYGYVSDEKLNELYGEADVVLALSRYESFGLLYLEAMRKGRPLVVFGTGAVPEIFNDGEDAIVLPVTQPGKVIDAIIRLKNDPGLRSSLGKNAVKKLLNRFSAERMGEECSLFFENLVFNTASRRVFQVMNNLTDRDGVSNITMDYDRLLREYGEPERIVGSMATPAVRHLLSPIVGNRFKESDLVIYHYWNYCEQAMFFNRLILPKKVFLFHNITTTSFFDEEDPAFLSTSRGYKQLSTLTGFDIYAAFSGYSLEILRQSLGQSITTFLLPPYIDPEVILQRPYDKAFASKTRKRFSFHIIFVGSIAPHKKQTDLVRFFSYYVKNLNPDAHLTIIGGGQEKYADRLTALVNELNLQQQVTITGKVDDETLYAYYRTADLYLSMSEHEGFGVPLAEAMAFDIPVAAYNCTAIPDTVGDNGCLFSNKSPQQVSELVESIRNDKTRREEVLERQRQQLRKFSREQVMTAFKNLFQLLQVKHLERLNYIKSQPDYLLEDFIHYNDHRLNPEGIFEYRDDQFLVVGNHQVAELETAFCEVHCSFLAHKWSGKVNIQVDDHPAEIFDLYFPGREIKTVRMPKRYAPGNHRLRIWPAEERNSFSQGNDVMLQMITLLKPFDPDESSAEGPVTVIAGESATRPLLRPGSLLQEPAGPKESNTAADTEDTPPEIETKVMRTYKEETALSPEFTYTGEWITKDITYKFTDSQRSPGGEISFEQEFVRLDLKFISHAWCGKAEVCVDGSYREIIDLYKPEHAIISLTLKKKFPQAKHRVTIRPLQEKNKASNGYEMFFGGIGFSQHLAVLTTDEELETQYKVSVIINTLDRDEHLDKLLKALEKQTYKYFEIIVVNGPSKDRTEEVLAAYGGRIKIAHCPEANLSQSRNIGIENAAGDYVAFIDDDALPCDQYWIENFIYFIIGRQSGVVGAVGGPVKHRDTENYEFRNGATSDYGFQAFREEELAGYKLDGKRWVERVPGGNALILKKALYDIGGFDEKFIYYLDETDVCIQLARKGYSILNNPVNYIRHYKAPSSVRKSNYDIRWDIISRSDMYFALKNGFDNLPVRLFKGIRAFRKKHFYQEIVNAGKEGKISAEEYKKYKRLLSKGFYEGLRWGLFQRKEHRPIHDGSTAFRKFKSAQ